MSTLTITSTYLWDTGARAPLIVTSSAWNKEALFNIRIELVVPLPTKLATAMWVMGSTETFIKEVILPNRVISTMFLFTSPLNRDRRY